MTSLRSLDPEAGRSSLQAGSFTLLKTTSLALLVIAHPMVCEATENSDPLLEKRGFVYLTRIESDDIKRRATSIEYQDFYVKVTSPKDAVQMLSISMPPGKFTRTLGQYQVTTCSLDCESGALRLVSAQFFDAAWNPQSNDVQLLGAKWERPMPGSVNAAALELGCK